MKNREKYVEELLNIACAGKGIAIDKRTMQIRSCEGFLCGQCLFDDYNDCDVKLAEWAESEYVEKQVISKRDRGFLDYFKDYEYMARDYSGELCAYKSRPIKRSVSWGDTRYTTLRGIDIDFPMVKWSDSEPWSIEDLKKLEVRENYEID